MTGLTKEIQSILETAFGNKTGALNMELDRYKVKIRDGEATDQDIEDYNGIIDQLVLYGSKKVLPDEFWTALGVALNEAVETAYPGTLTGTNYVKYKFGAGGIEVKEVIHQKRDGRPPTNYHLIADGEPIRRRDFLLQHCGETDSRISWSKVKNYAKDLVENGVFDNVELHHYDDEGNLTIKWSVGMAVPA